MVRHSKYRWIFNTQKLDRDIPRNEYEERTLAEKEAYDIKYPEDYDKRVYDFYSWRYHHKRKQLPETTKTNKISTAAKYGQYVPRDNSETISSVDSDEMIEAFINIDCDNQELFMLDEQAHVE
jgi:hypothetical protein